MRSSPGLSIRAALLGLAVAAAAPVAAGAQGAGRGFLFHEPVGSVTLRGGVAGASARSDIFALATEQLTLGRGDFAGPSFGADFAFRVAPRADLMFGAAYAGSSARSEFRDWVEETESGDRPIEQTTTFRRIPLTVGLRGYITPRGRTIGRFAWVPARTAMYVGAGGGLMWYWFGQQGDFVDAETQEIFSGDLVSSGWTPTAHALAGVDFSLGAHLALTTEGRYGWAKARMDEQFEKFRPIDLSGYAATVGLSIRF